MRVKSRLLALTNARTIDASGNRDTGPKRPTLKRRKDGRTIHTQPSTSTGNEKPKDKPVLKRRDSDGKPADKNP